MPFAAGCGACTTRARIDLRLTSACLPHESRMLSRRTAFSGLLATIPFFHAAAQTRPARDPLRDLDGYTAKAVRDWKVPGLAIAVVKDGRIVFAKGYGVREL